MFAATCIKKRRPRGACKRAESGCCPRKITPDFCARNPGSQNRQLADGFDQNLKNWWFCWFTKNQIVVFFEIWKNVTNICIKTTLFMIKFGEFLKSF
jgi:hypothetical protein